MIVGQTNGRTVFNDLAKITAELQPGGVVLKVVVDLVTGEKQHIGIDPFNVIDDVLPRDVAAVRGIDGIARKPRHNQFILIGGVATNGAFIGGG